MSNFKKTEAILYKYNFISLEIQSLEEEIKEIKKSYIGCGSIGYEDTGGRSNGFNSVVENEVISRDKELEKLIKRLQNKKIVKNKIDFVIQYLNEGEKRLIELRYLNKERLSWEEISKKLSFSVSHCKSKLRRRAVEKFEKILF